MATKDIDWKRYNELADEGNALSSNWHNMSPAEQTAAHERKTAIMKEQDSIAGTKSTYNPNTGKWSVDRTGSGIVAEDGNGAFKSNWTSKANSLMNDINNSTFSYDPYSDPAYKAYAEMYQREGQRATKSTLADIATVQGGMSSFAGQAAQQAANYYSQQLNDRIPELMALAYQKYGADLDRKQNMLNTYLALEGQDYDRWNDTRNYNFQERVYNDNLAQQALENSWKEEDRETEEEEGEYAKKVQEQADKDTAHAYLVEALLNGVPLGMLYDYMDRAGVTDDSAGVLRQQYLDSLKKNGSSVSSSGKSSKKKKGEDDEGEKKGIVFNEKATPEEKIDYYIKGYQNKTLSEEEALQGVKSAANEGSANNLYKAMTGQMSWYDLPIENQKYYKFIK